MLVKRTSNSQGATIRQIVPRHLVAVSLEVVHSTSGTKIIFPHFFVSEKGLAHIYKKPIYYFPISQVLHG